MAYGDIGRIEELTRWRRESGHTLKTLSNQLGIKLDSLAKIERGEVVPKVSTAVRLHFATGGEVPVWRWWPELEVLCK